MFFLRSQTPFDGTFGRFGRHTLFLHYIHTFYELNQTLYGFVSVLFLTSVLLGLYNDYALFGDTFVFE